MFLIGTGLRVGPFFVNLLHSVSEIDGNVEKNVNFVKIGKQYQYEYPAGEDQRIGGAQECR